jgi:hypothetical protein
MIERPEQRVVTERPDEDTRTSETGPAGGLSTADIAGPGTSLKSDDRAMPADRDMDPSNGSTGTVLGAQAHSEAALLFPAEDAESFRSRWSEIQTGFVDDPRHAVEQGDGLVAEVMKGMAETFAQERAKLEQQWDGGENVTTETLRIALQHYRTFFDRLLAM